jgi:hypothetical protein
MAALTLNQFYPEAGTTRQANKDHSSEALGLFYRSLAAGLLGQVWTTLTRRANRLADLDTNRKAEQTHSSHYAGIQSVPIEKIRGSQGRAEDFDLQFRPLQEHTRDRWLSVASALQKGIVLPPVELVQVGQEYFVRDGHHRISVARALGQADIDAEVTVLSA